MAHLGCRKSTVNISVQNLKLEDWSFSSQRRCPGESLGSQDCACRVILIESYTSGCQRFKGAWIRRSIGFVFILAHGKRATQKGECVRRQGVPPQAGLGNGELSCWIQQWADGVRVSFRSKLIQIYAARVWLGNFGTDFMTDPIETNTSKISQVLCKTFMNPM